MIEQLVRSIDRESVSRYDLVLAAIPAAFLVAALARTLSSVPPSTAVGAASLVAVLAMVDALFVNPPVSRG